MATLNREGERGRDHSGGSDIDDESLATKVVLVELLDASRPLSIGDLRDRTTLTEATVRSALIALDGVGICEQADHDGNHQPRFRLQD